MEISCRVRRKWHPGILKNILPIKVPSDEVVYFVFGSGVEILELV